LQGAERHRIANHREVVMNAVAARDSHGPRMQPKTGRISEHKPAIEEVHILWITGGLGCDGDSVSITAASQPTKM
jgi:Ni,Fe-hydrogenase I small subunit